MIWWLRLKFSYIYRRGWEKREKMTMLAPAGYHVVELNERVQFIEPELFRWKWQADRRCQKLNEGRLVDAYRHEVHDWLDGRWAVVAMQNQLQPDK